MECNKEQFWRQFSIFKWYNTASKLLYIMSVHIQHYTIWNLKIDTIKFPWNLLTGKIAFWVMPLLHSMCDKNTNANASIVLTIAIRINVISYFTQMDGRRLTLRLLRTRVEDISTRSNTIQPQILKGQTPYSGYD